MLEDEVGEEEDTVVSLSVRVLTTPPPHPKIQSCAWAPAGPTKVAKSCIDSGATHRNRPFRPFCPFPWVFRTRKNSWCG